MAVSRRPFYTLLSFYISFLFTSFVLEPSLSLPFSLNFFIPLLYSLFLPRFITISSTAVVSTLYLNSIHFAPYRLSVSSSNHNVIGLCHAFVNYQVISFSQKACLQFLLNADAHPDRSYASLTMPEVRSYVAFNSLDTPFFLYTFT